VPDGIIKADSRVGAIGGVIHAMQTTTTPDFTSWLAVPLRAMLTAKILRLQSVQ
jgi:hypothetical protein